MKFTAKVMNLDRPNRNNVIYTKEAINYAFKILDNRELPIYIYDKNPNYPNFGQHIGYAKLNNRYPELIICGQIYTSRDTKPILQLIESGVGGFGIGGKANMYSTNPHRVEDFVFSHIGYTLYPACETSFEIHNKSNNN